MSQNVLNRDLRARHIMMIALAGSIGTGLFVASGATIASAGPGGAVLAYALMGVVVYFLMTSLGEMSALMPTTGTFCDYSGRFVDPAFGFAMGYNYFYDWASAIPVELTAASILMQYWFPHVPIGIWAVVFLVLMAGLNFFHVRVYGETEYWFSFIKVSAVIIFIIVGTLMIFGLLGHAGPVGFKNWTVGDAPFHGGVLGMLGAFLVVGFAFQGTELVGVAAGEVKDPKTSVPRAIRNTFRRIIIFYILAISVIAFLVPYTNPNLINASTSNIALSPFTMVFSQAGLKFAGSVVNLIIITAVLSACNASMYISSRTLWFMSKQGQAPKGLSKVSRQGVPVRALLITVLFGMLSLLTWFWHEGVIFTWLINISALSGFVAWVGIAVSHYRFRKAYLLQGYKLADLPFKAKFYPLGPVLAAVLCVAVIIGQVFTFQWSWLNFFANYIGLIAFVGVWVGYKVIKKTKLTDLSKAQIFEPETPVVVSDTDALTHSKPARTIGTAGGKIVGMAV